MNQNKRLALIFASLYFASYVTRLNLAAVIQEVAMDTGFSKSSLSVVLVCLSVSYGIGQIINGWIGDRIKPQNLIWLGLGIATAANLMFPFFSGSVFSMCVLWTVNGFAQAMLWPPMVRILAGLMKEADYGHAVVTVNLGGSLGTILIYLAAPLIIRFFGWKAVLLLAGAVGLLAAVLWGIGKDRICGNLDLSHAPAIPAAGRKSGVPAQVLLPMVFISVAVIFQGMLRDGITSWMPTFLAENFHLGNEVSILCTVSLAIFSMVAITLAGKIYQRWFKSEVSCGAAMFAAAIVGCMALLLLLNVGAVAAILCMTAITGSMHGVNLMLVSHVPKRFRRFGNVSTMSGLINAFTYVGAAIATYGIARISESFGWQITIILWIGVACIGTICCLLALPKWKQFCEL